MNQEGHIPIFIRIYNPAKSLFKAPANEKAECNVYYCSKSEICPLLKKDQCINNKILSPRCVYGYKRTEVGLTRKARKFSRWIEDRKKEYASIADRNVNGSPPDRMVEIGEYVYFPYSFASMNKNVPFLSHSEFLIPGSPFILKSNFTIDNIEKIVNFRPHALMGGEITDYRLKIVPKIIEDLSEIYPDLYKQLIEKRPALAIKEKNYVGRKALLSTMPFPIKININDCEWNWDGKQLTTNSAKHLLFHRIEDENGRNSIENITITVTPKEKTVIKIENNSQVCDKTEFID